MALTGFLVAHQCAPTSEDATRLLLADFPQLAADYYLTASSATFVSPSTFNVVLKAAKVNSNVSDVTTKAFALSACDPALPVDVNVTVYDPVLAGGLWMFALVMVIGCWLLAKNAGVILSAIRRF